MLRPLARISRLALVAATFAGIAHAAPPLPQMVEVRPPPLEQDSLEQITRDIRRGVNPTDERIKALRTGPVEPVLLAVVGFRRDIVAIEARYGEQLGKLDLSQVGSAHNLASPEAREGVRVKMATAAQLVRQYRSDTLAAARQAESAISTAYARAPGLRKDWPQEQATQLMAKRRAFLQVYVPLEMERQTVMLALTQSLDDNSRSFVLSEEPEPHLVFSDAQVLARFKTYLERIGDVSARIAEAVPKLNAPGRPEPDRASTPSNP